MAKKIGWGQYSRGTGIKRLVCIAHPALASDQEVVQKSRGLGKGIVVEGIAEEIAYNPGAEFKCAKLSQ